MINCPKCQQAEPEGELFCSRCGARLEEPPPGEKVDTKVLDAQQLRKSSDALPAAAALAAPRPGQIMLSLGGRPAPIILEGHAEYILGREVGEQPPSAGVDFNPYGGRERGVSRQHASLSVVRQQVLLMDLGSTNGTRLNGILLTPHQPVRLKDGDEVRLGKLGLRVHFKL